MDQQTRLNALPRRDFLKITGLGALALTCPPPYFAQTARTLPFYVGTYTTGRKSEGIYLYNLDQTSGELRHLSTTTGVVDPSFISISPDRRFLYAVNELEDFGGKKSGAVSAFAIDRRTGVLKFLNQQPSMGASPCYIIVDHSGKFVLVANYSGGNVAVFPVNKDGSLGGLTDLKQDSGKGPNAERQEGPHAHCIELDPAGRFAYLCDLGADKIMIFRFESGKLIPNRVPWFAAKPGAGPRHLTFHPGGKFVYVINELHATVTALVQDRSTGELKEVQTLPTLPANFTDPDTSADIHVSPDGQFLYCSNRGHDSIAAFKIDQRTGELSFIAHEPTGGKTPRNFAIDPSGEFLLVANQNSDNIVTFRRDSKTGRLTPTGHVAEVPAPVCLKFTTPFS